MEAILKMIYHTLWNKNYHAHFIVKKLKSSVK